MTTFNHESVLRFREAFDFSQEDLARFLNTDPRTIRAWEDPDSQKTPRGPAAQVMAGLLEALDQANKDARVGNYVSMIKDYVSRANDVGGLAYLLVRLFDDWVRR